ncbi:M48 family metallopeptidase [Vallitalea guaymasensis]|uniref:M48 family metallopeptidase n=1 Tax=Vallitalea guaymasensis TaxID=1185412 RepID=UPI0023542095|nr:SprT family zinc-dependent metalloprotease [Vallitalea guaymasensis]
MEQMSMMFGTQLIEFTVKYSRRTTIEIGVEAPNIITVVAPVGINNDVLLKHVKSKAKWIVQKQFEIKEIQSRHIDREYVNGESFMYQGRNYSLVINVDKDIKKTNTKLFQGRFIITTAVDDQTMLKKSMESWYRSKALEKVTERVKYYQPYFYDEPVAIKVKEQKKRWASCTSKRELLFNWRSVMALSPVLDYIVVHEMCHIMV